MRTVIVILAVAAVLCAWMPGAAQAGFDFGLRMDDEGIKSFHLAVGDFYGVSAATVERVSERKMSDDELAVVFFLARRASVSPATIVDLRLKGSSWMDITIHYGLNAEIYYVDARSGPPYGKAYGHHMNKPRKEWRSFKLDDGEIVNLVNLKFMSAHYGVSPNEIMDMREKGESFAGINGKVKGSKGHANKQSKNHKKGKGD